MIATAAMPMPTTTVFVVLLILSKVDCASCWMDASKSFTFAFADSYAPPVPFAAAFSLSICTAASATSFDTAPKSAALAASPSDAPAAVADCWIRDSRADRSMRRPCRGRPAASAGWHSGRSSMRAKPTSAHPLVATSFHARMAVSSTMKDSTSIDRPAGLDHHRQRGPFQSRPSGSMRGLRVRSVLEGRLARRIRRLGRRARQRVFSCFLEHLRMRRVGLEDAARERAEQVGSVGQPLDRDIRREVERMWVAVLDDVALLDVLPSRAGSGAARRPAPTPACPSSRDPSGGARGK